MKNESVKLHPPPRPHLWDSSTTYSVTFGRDLGLDLDFPHSSPTPTTAHQSLSAS